jgi:hypothetical protein
MMSNQHKMVKLADGNEYPEEFLEREAELRKQRDHDLFVIDEEGLTTFFRGKTTLKKYFTNMLNMRGLMRWAVE